jgi:DNA-binding XRE family transcriptional regulator
MSVRVTVKVTKEGRYWVGVPDGFPGSCMGRSVTELIQEAQAIMPFMASGPDGTPVPDVVVDYTFTDVPVELSEDIHRYRKLVMQRRELDSALNELAVRTVKRLRSVAGLTDEDSAAMLGISRQRVNQLRNAELAVSPV